MKLDTKPFNICSGEGFNVRLRDNLCIVDRALELTNNTLFLAPVFGPIEKYDDESDIKLLCRKSSLVDYDATKEVKLDDIIDAVIMELYDNYCFDDSVKRLFVMSFEVCLFIGLKGEQRLNLSIRYAE